jgi:hypothetical protein
MVGSSFISRKTIDHRNIPISVYPVRFVPLTGLLVVYVFLAGKIIRTARYVVMKLPAKYPYKDVYEKCLA